MVPTWAYVKGKDSIYVNLFIGSTINVEKVAGTDVQMVQKTDYPWSGKVAVTVNPKRAARFSVYVRVPNRQLYQDGVTVLRAIDTAGGFTDFAKRSNIELRRENGQIIKVNWDKAMKDPKMDPIVYPNDQIIVHKRRW